MTVQAKKLRVKLGGSKLREKDATIAHGESYHDEGEERYRGYNNRTIDINDSYNLGGVDVVNIQTLSPANNYTDGSLTSSVSANFLGAISLIKKLLILLVRKRKKIFFYYDPMFLFHKSIPHQLMFSIYQLHLL